MPYPGQEHWETITVEDKQVPVVIVSATTTIKAGLIVVQGGVGHRHEYPGVRALRRGLSDRGVVTLGLNIPSLQHAVTGVSPQAQLQQAILLLRGKGVGTIFMAHYGEGAAEVLTHFIEASVRDLHGLILLSAYTKDRQAYDTVVEKARTWRLFLFDVTTEFDLPWVKEDAELRHNVFGQSGGFYRRVVLFGADHQYNHVGRILTNRVYGWIRSHTNKRVTFESS